MLGDEGRMKDLIIQSPENEKFIYISTPGYPEEMTGWLGERTQEEILKWFKENKPEMWTKVVGDK